MDANILEQALELALNEVKRLQVAYESLASYNNKLIDETNGDADKIWDYKEKIETLQYNLATMETKYYDAKNKYDLANQGGLSDKMEKAINDGMVYGEVAWQIYARADKKINAIKAFRHLTGDGLKESKDAVERWISNGYSPFPKDEPIEGVTLGELLGK